MKIKDIDEAHNLYIIKVYNKKSNLIKLGYSSKIKERLLLYYHHNPLVEIINTFYREDAKEFELRLHRTIKSVIMNEWYEEETLHKIIEYIKNGIPQETPKIINNHKINEKSVDEETLKLYNKIWADKTYSRKMIANYSFIKDDNLKKDVKDSFELNNTYTIKEVKKILNELYLKYNINKNAKSTDLTEFMVVKEIRKSDGRYVEIINKEL
jgi:hypothetical protein